MPKWNRQALNEWNRGVTSSGMTREEAKQLEQDIDYWASTIGAPNERAWDSPNGRGSFTVFADNHTVTRVDYSW